MGFEPTIPISQDKRLAGARTRPLCDPSPTGYMLSNGPRLSNTQLQHRISNLEGTEVTEYVAVQGITLHIQAVIVGETPGGMDR